MIQRKKNPNNQSHVKQCLISLGNQENENQSNETEFPVHQTGKY